ncbi:hypothetical protein F5H01DRAFT_394382, partial [Linnemannia elongata]
FFELPIARRITHSQLQRLLPLPSSFFLLTLINHHHTHTHHQMNAKKKIISRDHLDIQQHQQLKATATAIDPKSQNYNPYIAQQAQELNQLIRKKWQPCLQTFIGILADPILSEQVVWIMDNKPGITLADAVSGVYGVSTLHMDPAVTEAVMKEYTKEGGRDGAREGLKEDERQRARRRQGESDSLLDAVLTLMHIHAALQRR